MKKSSHERHNHHFGLHLLMIFSTQQQQQDARAVSN
jgi:hypothetical protein